jgi:hypothetical protein
MEEHYEQQQAIIDELECEVQMKCDEVEKMKLKIELLEKKLKLFKKSGQRMHDFLESMIEDSMFHDETFNKANRLVLDWMMVKQVKK